MSSEEAVEIARDRIDFDAPRVQLRNLPRGLEGRMWVVALYTGTPTNPGRCRQVEIDAESGDVIAMRSC